MVKRLIFVILFLALVFGGIFAWKRYTGQMMAAQMAQPQPPAVVSVAPVTEERWQPLLRAVGSLTAINGIDVSTEVAGKVSAVEFDSGLRVAAGDVLVRLDDTVDRATLRGLIADRRLAEVQFERSADLLRRNAVSQSEHDEAKARYDSARAKVSEQEAIISRKVIRAPFAGLLGLRRVDLGEFLSPGQPIVTLEALDPIYVDYALPERFFPQLAWGQEVRLHLDAFPDEPVAGVVTAIDSGVDAGTRSITVRATVANPHGRLRPGMFAEVETLMPGEERNLTIPRTAVSFNTYGDFVFVVESGEGDGLKVTRRQVITGASRAGRIAVLEGLTSGQRVVSAGTVKLRDGQAVTLDDTVALDPSRIDQP